MADDLMSMRKDLQPLLTAVRLFAIDLKDKTIHNLNNVKAQVEKIAHANADTILKL